MLKTFPRNVPILSLLRVAGEQWIDDNAIHAILQDFQECYDHFNRLLFITSVDVPQALWSKRHQSEPGGFDAIRSEEKEENPAVGNNPLPSLVASQVQDLDVEHNSDLEQDFAVHSRHIKSLTHYNISEPGGFDAFRSEEEEENPAVGNNPLTPLVASQVQDLDVEHNSDLEQDFASELSGFDAFRSEEEEDPAVDNNPLPSLIASQVQDSDMEREYKEYSSDDVYCTQSEDSEDQLDKLRRDQAEGSVSHQESESETEISLRLGEFEKKEEKSQSCYSEDDYMQEHMSDSTLKLNQHRKAKMAKGDTSSEESGVEDHAEEELWCPSVGHLFSGRAQAEELLKRWMNRKGNRIKIRNSGPSFVIFACSAEGTPDGKIPHPVLAKQRPNAQSERCQCPFNKRVSITKHSDPDWKLVSMNLEHTHEPKYPVLHYTLLNESMLNIIEHCD
ncbi:hypothetical protein BGX24_012044 [Mortierella sp. AD032]|nr:hypothetical protein BGX24_012044 [Mortierella sp. AD032]